jgi:O-antigen/teichoic acid export membrane protein
MRAKIRKVWTHGDVRFFVSGAPWKLMQTGAQLVSSIILTWYLANFTGGNLFAGYIYANSLMEILAVFSYMGIGDSLSRSVARGNDYAFVAGTHRAILVSLSGSVILGGLALWNWQGAGDTGTALSVGLCALFFPFYRPLLNYTAYLNGKQAFARESAYTTVLFTGRVVAVILAALWRPNDAWSANAAFFGAHVLLAGFFCLRCRREIGSTQLDPDLFSFATFVTLVSGVVMVENHFDKVLVGSLGTERQLEILYLGLLPYTKLRSVLIPAFAVFTARFANGTMRLTGRKLLYLLAGGVAVAALSFVFSSLVIEWFFPKFPESMALVQLCSLVLVVTPANLTFNVYFRAMGDRGGIMVPTLISRVFSLALAVPAWYWGGLMGLVAMKFVEQGVLFALHVRRWHAMKGESGLKNEG